MEILGEVGMAFPECSWPSFLLTGHTDWELGGYSFAALSWFDAQRRPYTSLSKASALNLGCLTEIQKMVF